MIWAEESIIGLIFFGAAMIFVGVWFTIHNIPKFIKMVRNRVSPKLLEIAVVYIASICLVFAGITVIRKASAYTPPPPDKLIILNIDGVLNHNKATDRSMEVHLYDTACVNRLNNLVALHNAKLLVCSSWRVGQTVESMQIILFSIGVRAEVIGLTPLLDNHTKDDEITMWLSEVPYNDYGGILLLDNDKSKRFESIQVKPSWEEYGFRLRHFEQADKMLLGGMPENFDIGKVSICKSEVKDEMNFGGHHLLEKPSSI